MSTSASASRMNVYVLTSAAAASRRPQIARVVEEISRAIPGALEYITEHDPGADQRDFVKESVKFEKLEGDLAFYNQYTKNMHAPEVSNARKHLEALQRAALRPEPSLILEDDAIPGEDHLEHLRSCLEQAVSRGRELILLGLPGREKGARPLREAFRALPVCDSYMVTQAGARKLSDAFLPVRFSTNVHLSYVSEKAGVEAFMVTPNVFLDGSKYGVYVGTVSPNHSLILNRQYVETRAMIADDAAFEGNRGKIEEAFATSPFKDHPEFLRLRAAFQRKCGDLRAAESTFATALKVLDNANGIANGETQLLRDYISLYSELQEIPKADSA